MDNKEALFRTWGAYFNYPQCCVDGFVRRTLSGEFAPTYMEESPFLYSGFIPCKCCHEKTKSMLVSEAVDWLGHNPFEKGGTALEHTQTDKFKFYAYNYGLDYHSYVERLKG